MYQLYDKNRDRPGTGAEYVKTASFFIKTGFSFVKNGLQSRLRPGSASLPHLCETFAGCLFAMLDALLCPVFASFFADGYRIAIFGAAALVFFILLLSLQV